MRKAVDDLSAKPSKVIRGELQTMHEKSLEPKDLKCVAKAVYSRGATDISLANGRSTST
jgi:hypothetical protein